MDETDDFRERIRQSFGRQPAMETIGARLTRIEQAMVEIELPFDPVRPDPIEVVLNGAGVDNAPRMKQHACAHQLNRLLHF